MVNLSYRGRYKDKMEDDSALSMAYRPRRTAHNWSVGTLLRSIQLKTVAISLLLWCFVINHYERSYVKRTIEKCQWSQWEGWNAGDAHRLALFADPQIMDAHSYPGRPVLVNWIVSKLLDNYHRRNWAYVDTVLDPDTVIFLGDLFDGGRSWDDRYWYDEFKRFNSIFYQRPNRKTIMSLPGNHDIGFGETVNITSLHRFEANFGPASSIHQLGNHTVVLLDTISLSDFDNPETMAGPRDVIDLLEPYDENEQPRILMSHVPLYRFTDRQACGPLRESKKDFPIMKGVQYQTVLDHELSKEVLAKVRPQIAFSGDDHDYCHVTHPYEVRGKSMTADEITVKSCAMNMGIEFPAIQLLSLNTEDNGDTTFKAEMCFLPEPYAVLASYIYLAIFNVVIFIFMFITPQLWSRFTKKITNLIPRDKYSLPIAELHNKQQPSFETLNRDFIALTANGLVVTSGVLAIFAVYFNAL